MSRPKLLYTIEVPCSHASRRQPHHIRVGFVDKIITSITTTCEASESALVLRTLGGASCTDLKDKVQRRFTERGKDYWKDVPDLLGIDLAGALSEAGKKQKARVAAREIDDDTAYLSPRLALFTKYLRRSGFPGVTCAVEGADAPVEKILLYGETVAQRPSMSPWTVVLSGGIRAHEGDVCEICKSESRRRAHHHSNKHLAAQARVIKKVVLAANALYFRSRKKLSKKALKSHNP